MKDAMPTRAGKRQKRQSAVARSEAAKRLAVMIESERRKIGHLTFNDLCSTEVIRQMGELERTINEFMLLAYVHAGSNGRCNRR